MKLTPWFPGDVKPVRVGVYERQYFREQLETRYSYWSGYKWSTWAPTPKGALDLWYTVGALQDLPWRGVLK
jgi:hypothetical protein